MISQLYSIAYGCPKDKRKNDCPLLKIDHLSFTERIEWIDKLSEKQKESILKYHSF